MSDYINRLSETISSIHDCRCSHFGTEIVREVDDCNANWSAQVELFHVADHPEAIVAYGWIWKDRNEKNCIIGVLQISPVASARDAVLSAIASDHFCAQTSSLDQGQEKPLQHPPH